MTRNKLNWKYCECGCHCHEVQVGSSWFSLYNNLRGTYLLCKGGDARHASYATKHSSFEEADKTAYTRALEELESMEKALGIKGNSDGDSTVSARV